MADPLQSPTDIYASFLERRQRELVPPDDEDLAAAAGLPPLQKPGLSMVATGGLDPTSQRPGFFTRAFRDVQQAVTSGELAMAPLIAVEEMTREFSKLLITELNQGEFPEEEAHRAIEIRERRGETETANLMVEGSKALSVAIPGMAAGSFFAKARGFGKVGTYLSTLGGGVVGDFANGFAFTDPEQQNLANLALMLGETDRGIAGKLRPVFEFLASDDEDPDMVNRLRNGAVNAMTDVFGEAAFFARDLVRLRKAMKAGTLKGAAKTARQAGNQFSVDAQEIFEQTPDAADLIYGHSVEQISPELAAKKGGKRFADAVARLDRRVGRARTPSSIDLDQPGDPEIILEIDVGSFDQ